MRRVGRTDDNHTDIKRALHRAYCTVADTSRLGGGFPDLVVWSPHTKRNHLLEIKDGSKSPSRRKLTPMEDTFHMRWPGDCHVVSTEAEALKAVGVADKGQSDGRTNREK